MSPGTTICPEHKKTEIETLIPTWQPNPVLSHLLTNLFTLMPALSTALCQTPATSLGQNISKGHCSPGLNTEKGITVTQRETVENS